MKFIVTLSFIALSLSSFSQNSISRIIEKVKPIKSPLSQGANRQLFYSDKLDTLSAVDRTYLTNELKQASQFIVNPKGGNSFADLDYRDPWGFWDDVTSMSAIGVIKQNNSTECLLYLMAKESESRQAILAAFTGSFKVISNRFVKLKSKFTGESID